MIKMFLDIEKYRFYRGKIKLLILWLYVIMVFNDCKLVMYCFVFFNWKFYFKKNYVRRIVWYFFNNFLFKYIVFFIGYVNFICLLLVIYKLEYGILKLNLSFKNCWFFIYFKFVLV